MKRILFAGESWLSFTTHVKGFDNFYSATHGEGAENLIRALRSGGYSVTYINNEEAGRHFPFSKQELKEFDAVILSDIGSNTLLLSDKTFSNSETTPNRCDSIRDYVFDGGAFMMIGGYLSFTGIDAKARYGETSVADVLPITMLKIDDRVEIPQGVHPILAEPKHPIFSDITGEWPFFLGYNRTQAKENSSVLATIGDDPFIASGRFGKGKSVVFTSDCSPHWGPPEFLNWHFYDRLWINIADWLVLQD